MKQRKDPGSWENHPCPLPSPPNKQAEGCVWRCQCGRRWRLIEVFWDEDQDGLNGDWQEMEPLMDDSDFEKLEKIANTRTSRWRHRS